MTTLYDITMKELTKKIAWYTETQSYLTEISFLLEDENRKEEWGILFDTIGTIKRDDNEALNTIERLPYNKRTNFDNELYFVMYTPLFLSTRLSDDKTEKKQNDFVQMWTPLYKDLVEEVQWCKKLYLYQGQPRLRRNDMTVSFEFSFLNNFWNAIQVLLEYKIPEWSSVIKNTDKPSYWMMHYNTLHALGNFNDIPANIKTVVTSMQKTGKEILVEKLKLYEQSDAFTQLTRMTSKRKTGVECGPYLTLNLSDSESGSGSGSDSDSDSDNDFEPDSSQS